ncbi:MAG: siroheme synthase CysG [Ostreibacterium sp.]
MNYYPLFADLRGRRVTVVGGGDISARKVSALIRAGADVKVVALDLHPELTNLHQNNDIEWLAGEYAAHYLDKTFLVIAATNDEVLNQRIYDDAEARHTLVNVVDNQPLCSFIVPAVIDRSPLQIAISSAGSAPVLARLLRQKLEAEIPQYLGRFAALAGRFRQRVKTQLKTLTERRRFWEQLFADSLLHHHLSRYDEKAAETALIEQLAGHQTKKGEVTFVGAGPGNVDLMTLGGLQAIQAADIVLYDALVSEEILMLVRRDAEKINVGKRARKHQVIQENINNLLVDYANQGRRIVRLKGGDSFVFGRGGEECQVLAKAGINFRIVPGITAAVGATAYAGIPLTHRHYAQTAVFITGHCRVQGDSIDWRTLALSHQTLVIYMGTIRSADITEQLIKHGRAVDTPVAVISHGTMTKQQTQIGELKSLPTLASQAPRPALIIIGEVVSLRDELHWFGEKNLPENTDNSHFFFH